MEFHAGEPQPDVGVEFLRLLVGMACKVEDQDAAARPENPEGTLDGPLGTGGVMERLAEEDDIDGG